MKLLSHLGKYRENYYDWYGFGLFKDFIIKNTPFFDRVKQIYFKDTPNTKDFLAYLKNDEALSDKYPNIHAMLRSHLIDIKSTITSEQIALLDPEFTAGTRR